MCETLEHLNFNPLPLLDEINRVTRDGGIIYLGMPNLVRFTNRVKMLLGRSAHPPIEQFFQQLSPEHNMFVGIHWREYTLAETVEMLEAMGYAILRQYFFHPSEISMACSVKNLIKRLAFVVPSLKSHIVIIGRKTRRPEYHFWFAEALR
jgi:hypothetical protein